MRVLLLCVLSLCAVACNRKAAPQPPVEGNPDQSPSAITIANAFGVCEDAGACVAECENGSADMCRKLGATYQFGTKDTPKDEARATAFYVRACSMKSPAGCVSAGQMYEFHHGVEKDDAKAASFYRQGCDLGYQVGCANYAIMLENGRGVARDVAAAATLYDAACKAGAGLACDRLRFIRADASASEVRDAGSADH